MPDAVEITAGITAVMVVLNAVLTRSTARMARSADRQAFAAVAQADAARAQLQAMHRPVLLPFQLSGEHVRFRGGEIPAGTGPQIVENPPDRQDLPRYSAAFLPVENVGIGPALKIRGSFVGPQGSGDVRFPTEAVAAGARGVVQFENWTGNSLVYSGNDAEVQAVLEYEDVGGALYKTSVTFDIGSNAYRSVVEEPSATS